MATRHTSVTPGKMIDEVTFNQIWEDARTLLALGVKHNAIITVENKKKTRLRKNTASG